MHCSYQSDTQGGAVNLCGRSALCLPDTPYQTQRLCVLSVVSIFSPLTEKKHLRFEVSNKVFLKDLGVA